MKFHRFFTFAPAIAVVFSWVFVSCASAAPRPNIIVIMSDDMGFSDIGCYGGEIKTPNLDRLAAEGLRFTHFYNGARCCPSRAALLTGLYSHQAGMGHMAEPNFSIDGYVGELNDHSVTIAQVLKTAGYAPYMCGKWHVSKFDMPEGPKDNWPMQRGFNRFYGTIKGAGSFFDPGMLCNGNALISAFNDADYKPQTYYYTDALSDHACRFIGEHCHAHSEQPFFLYVAYTAAHWPMQALEKDIAKYHGKYDGGYEPIRKARFERLKQMGLINPKWDLSPQWGDWDKVANKEWEARCMEVYAAMIDNMDQGIGRIVQTLKDNGKYDNTLVMYMEDNGGNYEAVGRQGKIARQDHPTLPTHDNDFIETDHRPKQTRDGYPVLSGPVVMPGPRDTYIAYGQGWGNVSNTPFREYKHFVHEGGISTPLIAHWPAGISRKGELEHQSGHLIDLMSTCVDLAGATYPKESNGHDITPMQGVSLMPAFEGKPLPVRQIFWEHEGNRAMRDGKWKLVAKYPAGRWELYDMDADRTEMHDLAATEPQRLSEMREKWEAWAKRTHALPWPWKPDYGTVSNDAKPARE